MLNLKYDKYIQLLKAHKNLVLIGAPGTGKTFMAQAIAEEMNARTEFVQFHPSYGYTEFVEGLRPIQDSSSSQITFERKDGVFKKFCKEAIKNLEDSKKSIDVLEKEQGWEEKLQQFVTDAIENDTSFSLPKEGQFTISDITDDYIIVENEGNIKIPTIQISIAKLLTLLKNEVPLKAVKDIQKYFNRTCRTHLDSYVLVIVNQIRQMQDIIPDKPVKAIERKDFVFIIDEINRGNASKIFGELFYAMDPSNRGCTKHKVQTLYQNLVPTTDPFAEGFYIPENVYILATMNDIDRSVESMDFAMRRRFTWKEITPDDTEDMLNLLDQTIANEAKARMHRLNEAIADEEGLGTSYKVGPSYFLKLKDHQNSFEDLWTLNLEPLLKEYLKGTKNAKDSLVKFHKAYLGESDED